MPRALWDRIIDGPAGSPRRSSTWPCTSWPWLRWLRNGGPRRVPGRCRRAAAPGRAAGRRGLRCQDAVSSVSAVPHRGDVATRSVGWLALAVRRRARRGLAGRLPAPGAQPASLGRCAVGPLRGIGCARWSASGRSPRSCAASPSCHSRASCRRCTGERATGTARVPPVASPGMAGSHEPRRGGPALQIVPPLDQPLALRGPSSTRGAAADVGARRALAALARDRGPDGEIEISCISSCASPHRLYRRCAESASPSPSRRAGYALERRPGDDVARCATAARPGVSI